ncbi:uncharacterized protein B0J16DRAFT_195830 [Fusarium flagelliforme]|uniref:Uncharacterized protein n=1 Tax=Fusarium flagelliforme TaxID=2675880 RepID=A0A395MXI1_9HYPO|nr:uncharacterized protein B0J16DRAFT_195830 [Fusarium flagelliforme]KAH7173706.1 hypothetical protein B0J16DRAFT_195830 [Fusarium flagelliforme]RFN52604.1 hypothetical protein FIE12Z_3187 [Fusarium flagelliforme]
MGENLVIYYNDSIDSDNLAAAMALWKATYQRPNTRLIWIIEPRQVCFGLSMTAEQVSTCKDLIHQHFASLGNPFKVLLGGLINQTDLDNIKTLTEVDRQLLQMAVKPEYDSWEHAARHGRLTAWDFASCLAEWSNNAPNEVFVDFESLDEIENPVNLNFHHHEELVNRSADELKAYDNIMKEPFPQRSRSLQDWYEGCAKRIEQEECNSKTSVQPLNLKNVYNAIETAASVRFFGGSSLRILRQFLEKGVASKVKCHLQVGSCDMSANLFANQFNIALNREAAKTVLNRSTEFSKFTVVPSHTAQSIKYSALGLKNAGGHCLEKRILGFNCREDPCKIVTNVVSLDGQYSDKAYAMPDLTAFLCALIPDYMGSKLGFIEVDEKDSNGALLFRPSDKGIQMYDLSGSKTLTESEVTGVFEAIARGEVLLDQA